jgi:hypothetical protein
LTADYLHDPLSDFLKAPIRAMPLDDDVDLLRINLREYEIDGVFGKLAIFHACLHQGFMHGPSVAGYVV